MAKNGLRDDRVGQRVYCAECGQMKAPRGRSAPMGAGYCEQGGDCTGYDAEPYPDPALWPNETEADFGYPAGNYYATKEDAWRAMHAERAVRP